MRHTVGRGSNIDWERLAAIGEAVGALSALLAAIALLGVLESLRLQRQQTRVAQLEAVRNIRMQLLLSAIDSPRFLPMWGYDPNSSVDGMRENAYISMVFSYLKMAFVVGVLSRRELTSTCRVMFQNGPVVRFWDGAREVYLYDHFSKESRAFAALVDGIYVDAGGIDALVNEADGDGASQEADGRAVFRLRGFGAAATGALVGAIGWAIVRRLRTGPRHD